MNRDLFLAKEQLEARFRHVVVGIPTSRPAPDMPRYVTLTCGGVMDEASEQRHPPMDSEGQAIGAWLAQAHSYADLAGGDVLIWRCWPELHTQPRIGIYSRMVITHRLPEKQEAA